METVRTLPKNWRDPEIVTHESFIAAVGPIRDGWEKQHVNDHEGTNLESFWPRESSGSGPFFLMLASLTGYSGRTFRRAFNGDGAISVRLADEVLVALDRPDLFHEFDIRPRASLAA